MPNCPHCTESKIYTKRSTAAQTYPLHLEEIAPSPAGRIVRCPECGSHWFDDGDHLSFIPGDQLAAVRSRAKGGRRVSDEDFALLARIGPTFYGMNLDDLLSFPVQATIDGEKHPTAALRVYRRLPKDLTEKTEFLWYSEGIRLEASDRALNPAFRASRLIESDVFPFGPAAKLGETPDGRRLLIDPGAEYYLRDDLSAEAVRSIRERKNGNGKIRIFIRASR